MSITLKAGPSLISDGRREELKLWIRCELQTDMPPANLDEIDVKFDTEPVDGNEVHYTKVNETTVRYVSRRQKHTWQGGAKEILAMVGRRFAKPAYWECCHKPGEPTRIRFSMYHHVAGFCD